MRRVILPLMLLVVACQPATMELSEEQEAEMAAEVNAVNAQYWEAWQAGDFERGMSFYYDSSDLAVAGQGAVEFGYTAVAAKYGPGMANVVSVAVTLTTSRTMVLAPDVVCTIEVGTYAATFTTGVTGPEMGFAFTNVWVRRDGEWKIHVAHESFPPPETESM
jgi:uncharacterized protein (TIGR02246 family)